MARILTWAPAGLRPLQVYTTACWLSQPGFSLDFRKRGHCDLFSPIKAVNKGNAASISAVLLKLDYTQKSPRELVKTVALALTPESLI